MTKTSELSTIDQYIAGAAPAARPILSEIRRVAKLAVPDAQEIISYKMPALKLDRNFFIFLHSKSMSASTRRLQPTSA